MLQKDSVSLFSTDNKNQGQSTQNNSTNEPADKVSKAISEAKSDRIASRLVFNQAQDEIKKAREEALKKRDLKASSGAVQVIVGMGTCGIAAGARDAMKSILETIEKDSISGVIVTQTGCIGLCEKEPIVQVVLGEQPKVTYGKVTPDVARRIMQEHVVEGKVVSNNVINI